MRKVEINNLSRRDFLSGTTVLGAASLLGWPAISQAEPPPEVTKIKLGDFPAICVAPGYLAAEFLYAEGFKEVEYVDVTVNSSSPYILSGAIDFWMDSAPGLVNSLANNEKAIVLAGLHSGCYELFANSKVEAIRDLKGKSVSISSYGSTEHIFVSSIVAYVGMDPRRDIDWKVAKTPQAALQAFVDGRADAYLGFAPQPDELRAQKVGHVILNTTQDRPWSQYFCCMTVSNRDFVRRNPVATKRALRAFLKAADICANDPARAARFMVDRGHETNYERALAVLSELPYNRWREANPEDTLRFHALRLHEVGMIKTHPNKLIVQGTDWRFLNELKKELKA